MKYHYLDSLKGSPKGIIGEILFKTSKKNIFSTSLCTPQVLEKLPFKIPTTINKFLQTNWHSIDCFEFKANKTKENTLKYEKLILYEVKTQKHNPNQSQLFKQCKFTSQEIKIYRIAEKIEIEVYLVKILFFKDWKYSISIQKFYPTKKKYMISNGSPNFQKSTRKANNRG